MAHGAKSHLGGPGGQHGFYGYWRHRVRSVGLLAATTSTSQTSLALCVPCTNILVLANVPVSAARPANDTGHNRNEPLCCRLDEGGDYEALRRGRSTPWHIDSRIIVNISMQDACSHPAGGLFGPCGRGACLVSLSSRQCRSCPATSQSAVPRTLDIGSLDTFLCVHRVVATPRFLGTLPFRSFLCSLAPVSFPSSHVRRPIRSQRRL